LSFRAQKGQGSQGLRSKAKESIGQRVYLGPRILILLFIVISYNYNYRLQRLVAEAENSFTSFTLISGSEVITYNLNFALVLLFSKLQSPKLKRG
jgi:hypothetical protein